jgi:5-methylthioadenosine/S-adenosylhomocysteine deaminase
MTTRSHLIRDVLIVPSQPAAPFYGWVEVKEGKIAELGRGTLRGSSNGQIVDGDGCALLPGFINTHAHSHSSLTRGSAEGFALVDWLRVIEREQSRLTEEQAYVGALATYAEALLSGTTTILDMCLHPAAAFRAARDIGIRAVIAPYVADKKPFTPSLDDTAALIDHAAGFDDRVRAWVGLHDLESCSDEQIRRGAELARDRGVGVHLHCSETRHSVELTFTRTGLTPIAQLSKLGALGPQTLLAHCVWVTEADRALLQSSGAHVAHCPHANLKLGSGIAPIPDLIRRQINVTLATDGAKANNRLDLFDVMKFASLLHKGVTYDPTVLAPGLVLDMGALHGARALDVNVGAMVPGMAADLIMVRLDGLHLQPSIPETVRTNLVHAARGSDVSMVMVGGEVVVKDGELLALRQRMIRDQAHKVAMELLGAGSPHSKTSLLDANQS